MMSFMSSSVSQLFKPSEEAEFISKYETVKKLFDDFERLPAHKAASAEDQRIFEPALKEQRVALEQMCVAVAYQFEAKTKPALQQKQKLGALAGLLAAFQGAATSIHSYPEYKTVEQDLAPYTVDVERTEASSSSSWFSYATSELAFKIRRKRFVMPVMRIDWNCMPNDDDEVEPFSWMHAAAESSSFTRDFRVMIWKKALRKATAYLRQRLTEAEFKQISDLVTTAEPVKSDQTQALRYRIQLATELVRNFSTIQPKAKSLLILDVPAEDQPAMEALLSALPIRTCDFFLTRP